MIIINLLICKQLKVQGLPSDSERLETLTIDQYWDSENVKNLIYCRFLFKCVKSRRAHFAILKSHHYLIRINFRSRDFICSRFDIKQRGRGIKYSRNIRNLIYSIKAYTANLKWLLTLVVKYAFSIIKQYASWYLSGDLIYHTKGYFTRF